eukprot:TRINITY_DN7587_c0_g1_i1.p1 TRINITY_DN7587_c0_g1~~TRINITY_DN7587_c0_g1_i1.p1  ORF type:complete len:260 (-),score=35.51 TRINITY_DN7587_c0_g1_i1:200-979(-)
MHVNFGMFGMLGSPGLLLGLLCISASVVRGVRPSALELEAGRDKVEDLCCCKEFDAAGDDSVIATLKKGTGFDGDAHDHRERVKSVGKWFAANQYLVSRYEGLMQYRNKDGTIVKAGEGVKEGEMVEVLGREGDWIATPNGWLPLHKGALFDWFWQPVERAKATDWNELWDVMTNQCRAEDLYVPTQVASKYYCCHHFRDILSCTYAQSDHILDTLLVDRAGWGRTLQDLKAYQDSANIIGKHDSNTCAKLEEARIGSF